MLRPKPGELGYGKAGCTIIAFALLFMFAFLVVVTVYVRPYWIGAGAIAAYFLALGVVAVYVTWVNNSYHLASWAKYFIGR